MIHPCIACDATGKVNFYISYDKPPHEGDYINDGELHDCLECRGTGELEGCRGGLVVPLNVCVVPGTM